MLPKSKCQVYIGYDDGAQAVKYYNAKTHKILTSHNFCHINPPDNPSPPEPIKSTPDMLCEGESAGSMPPISVIGSDDTTHNPKHKWNEVEGDIDINELQKTCEIHTDYQHLHNHFPEEDEEETFLTFEEVYAIIAGDKLTSLKEAKDSLDWPEWEWAMHEKLNLLKEMGTWETVQKPPDAVQIVKKWVFIKKQNKAGELVRHKARLVVKGCAQCPGQDYMETFLPVVRMDTLHAILALIAEKGLKMQQMDVKGAYLNGTLQETIYM
jgi:Reverse transcriptase (RNA-dependent DNA polymerase)